jgi:hypothetical protein
MSDSAAPPQVSPDGKFYWDGARWVPLQSAADTNLIPRGGRWFTPDGRLWWDGNRWLRYRRITWNSIHIYSNPPEDRATLSRNLGIWCTLFGVLGVVGLRVGALSIMAAVAGPVSIYYGLSFFRSDGQGGVRLPGGGNALAGIILSVVGLSGFLFAIVVRIVTH